MFYLKSGSKRHYIKSTNVWTICPDCGKQHIVDLRAILGAGDADLETTRVFCPKCSRRRLNAE